jgi:flavin-dependent dehydrogenase
LNRLTHLVENARGQRGVNRNHNEPDVVIVGGGPAGLAAAIAARCRGLNVTLADAASRTPLDKACGEGLMPEGVQTLHELGITVRADESAAFRGIRFVDGRFSAQGFFERVAGAGVRRTVLHRLMVERARDLGVIMYWGAPVLWLNAGAVRIGDQVVRTRWIVGADGQNSRVRRWAGLEGTSSFSGRVGMRIHFRLAPWTDCVEVYWHERIQACVTPVGPDEICVSMFGSSKAPPRIGDLPVFFPELAGLINGAPPTDLIKGAITTTTRLASVVSGPVALIGDASGSVDAISGQGLSIALRQALVLGDALANGNLAIYQAAHRRIMRMPRMMARLLLTMDGRTTLRRAALRVLAARPHLFSRLLAAHVGDLTPAAVLPDLAGLVASTLLLGALAGLAQL